MSIVKFNTEDIERALLAVALNAGSVTKASRELQARGLDVTKQTLHQWKTTVHADRYEQIQREAQSKISDRVAAEAEAFLIESAATERLMLTKLHQAVEQDDIKAADLPGAMRNLATSRALANDKIIGPLRNRPIIVEHHHNADEIFRKLESLRIAAPKPTPVDLTLDCSSVTDAD